VSTHLNDSASYPQQPLMNPLKSREDSKKNKGYNPFMKLLAIFTFTIFLNNQLMAAENTCSRTAVINYQEILVDTNSTEKGEGLRPYLQKDKVAKSYLNLYQEGSQRKWHSAAIGTLGTATLISSFFTDNSRNRRSLLIIGASLVTVNFFIAKTLENNNENNLERAIEEYNKRNLPRIYFNPFQQDSLNKNSISKSFHIEKSWSF